MSGVVRLEDHAINLDAIASLSWEKDRLYLHEIGGRFVALKGDAAQRLWDYFLVGATDLFTGEVIAGEVSARV